jgi:hypothetical protein
MGPTGRAARCASAASIAGQQPIRHALARAGVNAARAHRNTLPDVTAAALRDAADHVRGTVNTVKQVVAGEKCRPAGKDNGNNDLGCHADIRHPTDPCALQSER